MRHFLRSIFLHILIALLTGLGIGLAYSWFISPVTYVDASPAILRSDFKDQYRSVIAASYASTRDLARARARLELLGDMDPVGELSAQAQQMQASGESIEVVQLLAQLATDLQRGVVSIPATNTPFVAIVNTPTAEKLTTEEAPQIEATQPVEITPFPTSSFEQTPLAPQQLVTPTARPTFTSIPKPGTPFTLVSQDTICNIDLQPGLMQFTLIDSRRRQVAGIEIIVNWAEGEDHFFTGFKPELGNGYADFIMQSGTIYSVRVAEGGAFVSNIFVPTCTDPNGKEYLGGLLLTFQQP
ncbi:MAG: hypothetical protein IPN58_05300 [Anaerolineales bacterium]|nr:hypothetical protein [Anaerolineales bacterium]